MTNPHLVDGEYNTSGTVTRLEQDFITVSLSEDIRYDDYWFPAGTELRSPMDQTIADAIQQEGAQSPTPSPPMQGFPGYEMQYSLLT